MLSPCEETSLTASDRKILLFDLEPKGHHSVYLRHLVQHWRQSSLPGQLHLILSPGFVETHADLIALASDGERLQCSIVSETEYAEWENARSLLARSFIEWKLFCRYAKRLGGTQALLMYLDSLQLPLAIGEASPCPVSGIYFRPTFHYGQFSNHQTSLKEKIRQWRQKAVLGRILQRPQFKTLFSLDRFAVPTIQQLNLAKSSSVQPLADPVQIHHCDLAGIEPLRQQLQISSNRHVFLLFGELSDRKGVHQTLNALKLLPKEVEPSIAIVFAGPVDADSESIHAEVEHLRQSTQLEIALYDRYIKGNEVQQFFELADTVLALYQKHVGMSSILLHAAAAEKPVISTDYGLMGAITQKYQLGWAIDSTNPAQIARSLSRAVDQSIACHQASQQQFVAENQVDQFVNALIADFAPMDTFSQASTRYE
ncbi:MAG: glycosyltransferase [Leptolyngbya sp. Prado105]|jgi:glycosyltransferase involved in cell wall biosynthesis|nr:glycosyltransferase [Leptolyngbya sp. Prado105]